MNAPAEKQEPRTVYFWQGHDAIVPSGEWVRLVWLGPNPRPINDDILPKRDPS